MTYDQVENVSVRLKRKSAFNQINSAFKLFMAFCIAYSLIPVQIGCKSLLKWECFVLAVHQRNYFAAHCPVDFARCYMTVTETVADPRYADGHHPFTPLAAMLY